MKIHREGKNILLILFIILALLNLPVYLWIKITWLAYLIHAASIIFFFLVVNFFRSPKRHFKGNPKNAIVAPADGVVVVLEEVLEDEYFHDKRMQVSIFMNIFNVHANWFPVDGKVKFVHHQNGNFHKAWLPKASEENEHADIMLETEDGTEILCRQIAGAVARRIVTYAKPEEDCYIDEHLGFIKFGSRVDVYLPLGTEVCVKMGQSTTGDKTVIAKLK